ncbi:MAG TPA: hypothetical protein VJ697_02820, partial [Nitrososphaeraceae archaeon]|nr:hypothetical protein [Nitrososphaeraceae archaeon]
KTEVGKYQIPNPIADLNRLEILFHQYLKIYQDIINHIHFNIMNNEYSDQKIRGKINWFKTIQQSKNEYPLVFVTHLKKRDFITAENILLVLCSVWMNRDSTRLLLTDFEDPLTNYTKNLLNMIRQKTKIILEQFPFQEVLFHSKKFSNLPLNDNRIKFLENEALLRLKNGLIYNSDYKNLFYWIERYKELNISHVSAKTSTHHILESIYNLDTIYEAWIFLEFVDYLYEKGILVHFQLNNPHCQFLYEGKIITFWYEKIFSKHSEYTWVLEHTPDFTAMKGDEILAVFDAKNYTTFSPISETINKMLAYMTNLDTNFGALIFPYHPKNWNELNKSQKIEKIQQSLKSHYISREKELKTISKKLSSLSIDEIPEEYKNIILPFNHMEKFENIYSNKASKFHLKQTLCLLRFSPDLSGAAISMKELSLDTMFKAIVSRI